MSKEDEEARSGHRMQSNLSKALNKTSDSMYSNQIYIGCNLGENVHMLK